MATAALSACTSVTGGNPVVENINNAYTGPELSTSVEGADVFMPGAPISIGVGANRIACTAGWLVDAPEGFTMVTAGHCARFGEGSPVYFTYTKDGTTREVPLGEVVVTSFAEPYNHAAPDIALVKIKVPAGDPTPGDIYPDSHILIASNPPKDADQVLREAKGEVACWFYGVKSRTSASQNKHCGTIVKGTGNKVIIKPDSADDYTPAASGAPVLWNLDETHGVPIGIVTDLYKGHIMVDTIGKELAQSGSRIRNYRR